MLVAQDKNGKLVNLLEGIPEPQDFLCPACQKAVRLRNGKVMRPHFAHISLKNCCFFQENESEEHLSLKADLYMSLAKSEMVQVEKLLPDLGQIADLFVGEKLALEVQCSRLSEGRLRERTLSYQKAGYQVLWLLGEKLWLGNKITSLQKQFLYFSQNMGFHLWELDKEQRQIRLKYLIYEDLEGNLSYLEKVSALDGDLMTFFRSPFASQPLPSYRVKQNQTILSVIQRGLMARHPRWLARQAEAYVLGGNLLAQTVDDFFPQVRPLVAKDSFCQISQDLSDFCTAFFQYYKKLENKQYQRLYPPIFYKKALAKASENVTIKEK